MNMLVFDAPTALASEEAAPPAGEAEKPKPKPKPKPKKLDKDKNCQWETDISIEIDSKTLSLNQATLMNLMKGSESVKDGYALFADTMKLILKVRTPENLWYIANMTRLGDPNEGCVFYMVGEPQQVERPPPLF